ncbi:MAG: peptidylprolyl isomerase [Cytophagales bacterium]|nr:peptidylprolyl isomerase [Cytophagales bacterium]
MIITYGKPSVVSLAYDLAVNNGEGLPQPFESRDESAPMVFLYGTQSFMPYFETQLDKLEAGDEFEFTVPYDKGYGGYDEKANEWFPLSTFENDGEIDYEILQVGNIIPMADEDGHQILSQVLEITEDQVKMDFNHPLAGYDLHFTGKILSVREATAEEIEHGHVHAQDGSCSH